MLIGIGGAHQGVLAAAAIRSAGGDMQCRFKPRNDQESEQCLAAGILDLSRRYTLEELAGDNVMFAATGVTTGDYLRGVRFFSGGALTNSVVMRSRTRTVRFINAIHHFDFKPEYQLILSLNIGRRPAARMRVCHRRKEPSRGT